MLFSVVQLLLCAVLCGFCYVVVSLASLLLCGVLWCAVFAVLLLCCFQWVVISAAQLLLSIILVFFFVDSVEGL